MGLLGTSLAGDLRNKYIIRGCDISPENLDFLKNDFLVTHCLEEGTLTSLQKSDIIIIATPVEAIYGIFEKINVLIKNGNLPEHITVTDLASTKSDLMEYYNAGDFHFAYAGSHPMAGSDRSGPQNAENGIFQNATIYITPSRKYPDAVEKVAQVWKSIGACPHLLSHEEHDRYAAYLSHGLHLVSCMVSHLMEEIPGVYQIRSNAAGGSFRDITRVSGSNPVLWDGIISSNKKEVIQYLKSLRGLADRWIEDMESGTLSIKEIFEASSIIRKKVIGHED